MSKCIDAGRCHLEEVMSIEWDPAATISDKLNRLKHVPSEDLLAVLCCRTTFDEGPDAAAFIRVCVERLDEVRAILKVANEDEWTVAALRRALDATDRRRSVS